MERQRGEQTDCEGWARRDDQRESDIAWPSLEVGVKTREMECSRQRVAQKKEREGDRQRDTERKTKRERTIDKEGVTEKKGWEGKRERH